MHRSLEQPPEHRGGGEITALAHGDEDGDGGAFGDNEHSSSMDADGRNILARRCTGQLALIS